MAESPVQDLLAEASLGEQMHITERLRTSRRRHDLNGAPERTFNFNQAVVLAESSEVAGHTDWRLPTADEAKTLLRYIVEKPFRIYALPGFDVALL